MSRACLLEASFCYRKFLERVAMELENCTKRIFRHLHMWITIDDAQMGDAVEFFKSIASRLHEASVAGDASTVQVQKCELDCFMESVRNMRYPIPDESEEREFE